jgi:hypothetical protein
MRYTAIAFSLFAMIASGCESGADAQPAPICTDQVGCPEGSRCIGGIRCEGEATGRDAPRGSVIGGPGHPSPMQPTDASLPDAGAALPIDASRPIDAAPPGGLCGAGRTACGDDCVDVRSDPNHCGGCGIACTGADACQLGTCCGAAEEVCSGRCVDLSSDPRHCGVCDRACDTGLRCSAGTCIEASESF